MPLHGTGIHDKITSASLLRKGIIPMMREQYLSKKSFNYTILDNKDIDKKIT